MFKLNQTKHFQLIQFRIFFIFLLLFISGVNCTPHPEKSKDIPVYYSVTKVVDGDTFWLDDGSLHGIKVRLIGIDTPEIHNSRKKSDTFYGEEARDFLVSLIGGKKVRLEYDVELYDKYGRTLAYVYLENGIFVNAELVKRGYAKVMTVPPNVRYAETFVNLARKARKQKKGLWSIVPD